MNSYERIRRMYEHREANRVPSLKENGGFIFSSDHSIPNNVSLAHMQAFLDEIKRLGRY